MRAIISVADRQGLVELVRELQALRVEIFVFDDILPVLREEELDAHALSELTPSAGGSRGGELMLQPALLAAIQARRAAEVDAQKRWEPVPVDVVVVNPPSLSTLAGQAEILPPDVSGQEEMSATILMCAAARNFAEVVVLTRPQDYMPTMQEWREQGEVSLETRRRLAATALRDAACYDSALADRLDAPLSERFPERLTLALERIQPLRYGENPHQQASLYRWSRADSAPRQPTVADADMLQGKALSYNNLLDLDVALTTVRSFTAPTLAIVKHTNPCGVACDEMLLEAYRKAHAGDPISASGGVIGSNRAIDEATALEISQLFYEAIIAPTFTPAARDILRGKKSLRLLATQCPIDPHASNTHLLAAGLPEVRSISGGLLVQSPDVVSAGEAEYRVVSEREPTLEEVTALVFAWKVARCVKSNAIVLARRLMVVGVGAGQMNRVTSVHLAVSQAGGDRARGSVLASDAFFPFPDGVEAAARAGVTAIIQPGGSMRDNEAIEMANRYALAMIFTGKRHFRH